MDKDKFETQSGGHIKEGHQESDVSVKGVVWSGVILAAGGVLAFVLMIVMIRFLEKWEKDHEARLTPMEQQLQQEREQPKEGFGKAVPATEGEIKPAPDWYGRGTMDDHLRRTIKAPRLQYDDEHDMSVFRESEEKWLGTAPGDQTHSTGRLPDGSIHIPISRAMEILAQRGLPQVSGPFQPANVGAPSAAYPSGAADNGQPAGRATPPAAGVKK
ncbi:MAG TPA: hypothetical protein VKV30_12195 [Candidatus Angelobacter sp.]|nr:hypothetical protein [Candidatus Angelobacter sp.]